MAMPWPPPTHIDSNPMVLSASSRPRIPPAAEALAYWNDTNTILGDRSSTCSGVAIGRSSS